MDDCELLIHYAARSLVKDDAKWRAVADGVMEFKPAILHKANRREASNRLEQTSHRTRSQIADVRSKHVSFGNTPESTQAPEVEGESLHFEPSGQAAPLTTEYQEENTPRANRCYQSATSHPVSGEDRNQTLEPAAQEVLDDRDGQGRALAMQQESQHRSSKRVLIPYSGPQKKRKLMPTPLRATCSTSKVPDSRPLGLKSSKTSSTSSCVGDRKTTFPPGTLLEKLCSSSSRIDRDSSLSQKMGIKQLGADTDSAASSFMVTDTETASQQAFCFKNDATSLRHLSTRFWRGTRPNRANSRHALQRTRLRNTSRTTNSTSVQQARSLGSARGVTAPPPRCHPYEAVAHLPDRIKCPVPSSAERGRSTFISSSLTSLEHKFNLAKRFRPACVLRDVRSSERGYWRLRIKIASLEDVTQARKLSTSDSQRSDTLFMMEQQGHPPESFQSTKSSPIETGASTQSSLVRVLPLWTEREFISFYSSLIKFVGRGRAGWGVRVVLAQRELVEDGVLVSVRTYTFGEVLGHIWLALLGLSRGLTEQTPMEWFGCEAYPIVTMTGNKDLRGEPGLWTHKGPHDKDGRWGTEKASESRV